MNEAFITGSRAYGVPREDSDIDLAVVVSEHEAKLLRSLSDSTRKIVFGRLNLILFTNTELGLKQYETWKKVNDALKLIAPVTRDVAVRTLINAGIQNRPYSYDGGY